jgi:hypothetical protein
MTAEGTRVLPSVLLSTSVCQASLLDSTARLCMSDRHQAGAVRRLPSLYIPCTRFNMFEDVCARSARAWPKTRAVRGAAARRRPGVGDPCSPRFGVRNRLASFGLGSDADGPGQDPEPVAGGQRRPQDASVACDRSESQTRTAAS